MLANRVYPGLVHHRRWARNGMIPDAKFAKALVRGLNHISAYRRKTFLMAGDWDNAISGTGGSTVMHRFRCHTGYAATHIAFELIIANTQADGFGDEPQIQIDVTEVGGATTTVTRDVGFNDDAGSTAFAPNNLGTWDVHVPVDADTSYEVTVTAIDHARLVSIGAREIASNIIDESVLFYIEDSPTLFFPIYDRMRLLLAGGLSDMWKRNGSHLLSWTTNGAASPTFASTTWTNVIDGATSVAASTAGYYLGADAYTLDQHCRIASPGVMHVVLAAHGSCAGGSTGEVRLQDSTGTHLSLTGIGAASQWYATTPIFADASAFQKLDLQARVAAGGSTLTLNAVSLYAYVA
jgi:hypothetical protein